ncbi:hypothetical protein DFS34DRAFT_645321 [Phlyctochytrium arcticum]|nr:hypothetical protein DFS34DRAFT_654139 [Phlyctochytrium arcticum]KAI9104619.1 hypothetical protein DFS34DRAFT_645321 [Phlyctochytrium arcticum]
MPSPEVKYPRSSSRKFLIYMEEERSTLSARIPHSASLPLLYIPRGGTPDPPSTVSLSDNEAEPITRSRRRRFFSSSAAFSSSTKALRLPPSPRSKLTWSLPFTDSDDGDFRLDGDDYSDQIGDNTWIYGWVLLSVTIFYFCVGMWYLFRTPVLRDSEQLVQLLSEKNTRRVPKESYYALLIPQLGPAFIYFIFFNWLGLKFFRHNA